jgi:hypothetical protein
MSPPWYTRPGGSRRRKSTRIPHTSPSELRTRGNSSLPNRWATCVQLAAEVDEIGITRAIELGVRNGGGISVML